MALYGGRLLDLTNKDTDTLCVTWRKCIRKLIGIFTVEHIHVHKRYDIYLLRTRFIKDT